MNEEEDICRWCANEAHFVELDCATNIFCNQTCQLEFYTFEAGLRLPGAVKKIFSSQPKPNYNIERILTGMPVLPTRGGEGGARLRDGKAPQFSLKIISTADRQVLGRETSQMVDGRSVYIGPDYVSRETHILLGYRIPSPVTGTNIKEGIKLKFQNKYLADRETEFVLAGDDLLSFSLKNGADFVNYPDRGAIYVKLTHKEPPKMPEVILKLNYSKTNKDVYVDVVFLRYELGVIEDSLKLANEK